MADGGGQGYYQASRAPRYSLFFALPLLLGYEVLAVVLPQSETRGVRNGAEVIFRLFFDTVAGSWGNIVFGATVIGIAAWLIALDVRANGAPTRVAYFIGMILESIVLAAAFGVVTSVITVRVLGALHFQAMGMAGAVDARTQFMVALGAGIFEELLFRVVLVTLLLRFAKVAFGFGDRAASVVAIIGSAVIFSAFHYVGPYGDTPTIASFLFRAVGGLIFSAIYVLRGFGIVAWTHALYDVGILLLVHP